MSASQTENAGRDASPDPASHAANIYDSPDRHIPTLFESEDDDIDFEPPTTEESEYFETGDETTVGDEDDEVEFHDATDDLDGAQIQLNIEPAANGSGNIIQVTQQQPENAEGQSEAPAPAISRSQILRLLNTTNLRRLLELHGGSGHELGLEPLDEDSDGDARGYTRRRRRPRGSSTQLPPVPNPEGEKLMSEGVFGRNEGWDDVLRKRKKRAARRMMMRELNLDAHAARRENEYASQCLMPSSKADKIIHYNSKCYSGQFSDDGNFFFSCAQDFNVRMYDTSNPFDWKYYKTVNYPYGQWTITDATLSPDNRFLAYSSIRSAVCLASTDPDDNSEPQMLNFAGGGGRRGHGGSSHFGIWSIRFSGDGREIVAGTGDNSVNVFDLEASRTVLRIPGHQDDVNAVCYGDQASPHILYSGSDDTLIKVWDRRSMGDNRAAGVFMGHTEGLTYVDSRGDGRYVLSNGKDQTMKLWDLRRMTSTDDAARHNWRQYTTQFDYRFMSFSPADYTPHPHDGSVVTFRGHSVLRTLIRCHFSPPNSTNSRYVYSGSEDGCVYVYNLDATLAGKIDVKEATFESRPRDPGLYMYSYEMDDRDTWRTCVRDASWHPNAPMIAATSWNGWGGATGTCTVHSWSDDAENDESGMPVGQRVNHRLEPDPAFYNTSRARESRASTRSRLRSRRVGRAALDDVEDASPW